MNPDHRGVFRRNLLVVAALHLATICGLWIFAIWKNSAGSNETVAWLDGGGFPAGAQQAGAEASPAPADSRGGGYTAPTPAPSRTECLRRRLRKAHPPARS